MNGISFSADEKSKIYTDFYPKVNVYVRGKIADPHEAEDIVSSVFLRVYEKLDSIPVCRGNRGMVAVSAGGNVFPCMQMSGYYEAHGDILGNAKEQGLQPLLQYGKYLHEVCTTVGTLASVNKTCGACPYFKHCLGGCRAVALTLTGDKPGVDLSKCLFFQKGYVQKIEDCLQSRKNLAPMEI